MLTMNEVVLVTLSVCSYSGFFFSHISKRKKFYNDFVITSQCFTILCLG